MLACQYLCILYTIILTAYRIFTSIPLSITINTVDQFWNEWYQPSISIFWTASPGNFFSLPWLGEIVIAKHRKCKIYIAVDCKCKFPSFTYANCKLYWWKTSGGKRNSFSVTCFFLVIRPSGSMNFVCFFL